MALLQLSQSHLTLIEHCPRKFQYIYLDHLTTPVPSEERDSLTRGNQIHHLMQQQELSLLPFTSSQNDRVNEMRSVNERERSQQELSQQTMELYQVVNALASAVPTKDRETLFRQSEYRLNLNVDDVLLTVVYDLLILESTHAHIFDWKTYARPPKRQDLEQHWQTKLYPFVLVEMSTYEPDAVDLSYWFIRGDASEKSQRQFALQPDCIQFSYSDRLHESTRASLNQVITQLKQWIQAYQTGEALPQTLQVQERCTTCQFALRCQRMNQDGQFQWEALQDIDAMDEIVLG